MICIKKSVQLWDHVPELKELREAADPEIDSTIENIDKNNVELYLKYTGLRIFTNGRDFKAGEKNIRSEMKYYLEGNQTVFPEYVIPEKDRFILI